MINKQLIQEKKKGGQYKLASTKNSKGRTVRIPPSVIELFRQQKAKQTSWKKEAGLVDAFVVYLCAEKEVLTWHYSQFKKFTMD